MKTQSIRLADVFIIGPLMVWGGWSLAKENPVRGLALAALGGATILYNGQNYLRARAGNQIPGGHAAGKTAQNFDPRQLRAGVKVEMEHTTDPDIAQEIAMDHLVEDPNYYVKLQRIGL